MSEEIEELKKLLPKECLARLKELEEKKKKELEEAHMVELETEGELFSEEEYKRKVPIEQVKVLDPKLLSEPAKEIFEQVRGREKEFLEEVVENSPSDITEKQARGEYIIEQLAQKPIHELYSEMQQIYRGAKDEGYISAEDMHRAVYITEGVKKKRLDIERGRYSPDDPIDLVHSEISLTEKMKGVISNVYKSKSESDRKYVA